ncbi:asparaginase [Sulfurovum sp. NBC37-1]|uniref:asparaginase n=1 Tax=Sulfurovum sp. (strain NBC37-1) TaxID=387093 RepID=UPI00015875B8|nr:asparaginase [Sulfurovum sp. NBC37-1]BAF71837.1 L-asparaginase [Sulfurovum sp. NBC37-1]
MRQFHSLLKLILPLLALWTQLHAQKNLKPDTKDILPVVVVVTTGGTIAMKYDPVSGGVVPAVSGKDLLEAVPGLGKIAKIETVEFCNIDSSQMTPKIWRNLSLKVDAVLRRPEVAGVVVTHGTDTMAEGAYFLETTLHSQKPVVFVGSMRSNSDLSPDGPANLYNAVFQAASSKAEKWGVTVTMNQYINSARYVCKDNTTNVQTFDSGGHGYLGYIVGNRIIGYNAAPAKKKLSAPKTLPDIPLIYSYAGDDGSLIRYAVDHGAKGLVVAGVGAGNVNQSVFKACKYALNKNVPLVIASRVRHGGVYPLYGDEGGGASLLKAGTLLAGDLSPYKARLLLMIALGQPNMNPPKAKENIYFAIEASIFLRTLKGRMLKKFFSATRRAVFGDNASRKT